MDSARPTQTRTGGRPTPTIGAPTFRNAKQGTGAEFPRTVFALFDWLDGVAPTLARHRRAHHRRATGEAHAP